MFDIIVVGGGMVGASIAVKLAQAGFSLALIEKQPPAQFDPASAIDLRVSALSLRSEAWLQRLGAWQRLQQMRLCPYRYLQAVEGDASICFDAADIQQTHLGHIVENNLVQQALWQQFDDAITVFSPADIQQFSQDQQAATLTLADGSKLTAKLIIAADGGQSQLRQLAAIGTTGWQYRQACLVAHVTTPYPQQDITWQHFTENGPRAFLPLPGNQASLVWYDQNNTIKQLAALPVEQLEQQIKQHFPERLGEITLLNSSWFPLARMHTNSYVKQRLVLAGDAAHTINPLAGQGVNLGFADAILLTELLIQGRQQGKDPADAVLLRQYEQRRTPANLLMMSTMDAFYQLFSSPLPPVRWLRKTGLTLAEHSGVLKRWVTRYAVGLD